MHRTHAQRSGRTRIGAAQTTPHGPLSRLLASSSAQAVFYVAAIPRDAEQDDPYGVGSGAALAMAIGLWVLVLLVFIEPV